VKADPPAAETPAKGKSTKATTKAKAKTAE
jgi:hypothetical protein